MTQRTRSATVAHQLRRRLATGALALQALLGLPQAARAAEEAAPLLLHEATLAPMVAQLPLPAAASGWREGSNAATLAAACATTAGSAPRIALLARPAGRLAIDNCHDGAGARVTAIGLGRFAVALATPATGQVFAASDASLFKAFGAMAGGAMPARWNELDTSLPALPVRLLAPPPGSPATALFGATVMEAGCRTALGPSAPFLADARIARCGTLRQAAAIQQRDGADLAALRAWARGAAPGSLALVTLQELRDLQGDLLPLPLGGALPTVGNIQAGIYPAAQELQVVLVRPRRATDGARAIAARVAFELLSERSLGPGGAIAGMGVVPPPAAERVALRARAAALFD